MKGLSESQASDERIGLHLLCTRTRLYEISLDADNENDKLDRYFFSKPKHGYSKRPLFRNGIARCGGSATIHTILKEQILMS